MYIIAGLGNPGSKYENTRHNAGFEVLDLLIREHRIAYAGVKFHAMCGSGFIGSEKVLLLKPMTYMNLSGNAVAEAVQYYHADPARDLIVVSDDIALEPGRIRVRRQGSAGGQNGLKHIIARLGTDQFARVRVGTGAKPEGWDLADWVLSHYSKEDRALVDEAEERAARAVACMVTDSVDQAMNLYNH